MKIIKQCRDFFPSPSSGHLLGLDINGVLHVTNSYPLSSSQDDLPPGANLETERRRQQTVWIKTLSEVNVDNNIVGWYQSAYLGSFMNVRVVEGLFAAGQNQMLNDKAILIIHGTHQVSSYINKKKRCIKICLGTNFITRISINLFFRSHPQGRKIQR
jgi:translation initiation factor 3 subunit H